jgi:hypothetical protein
VPQPSDSGKDVVSIKDLDQSA